MIAPSLVFLMPVWPVAASEGASNTDALFVFEITVSAITTLLIFATIFVFGLKYARRSQNERPRRVEGLLSLEAAWTIVPLIFFLIFFFWAAQIFYAYASPPKDSMQIYVVGKQWMWYVQHPGGQREINEVHVPSGRNVQFILTSQDVIHSFYMPAFRIKKDAVPGMYTTEWFHATRTGDYHLFCAEYCGTNHSHMIGTVHVMSPADFEQWLAAGARGDTMAQAGAKLYQRLGCSNCHNVVGPSLDGLYMKGVGLADGRVAIADDAYLRESILDPGAKIVAGFPNLMPSFQGIVTEEGIMQLIAHIKSLGTPAIAGPGAGTGAGQGSGTASGAGAPREQLQQGLQSMPPPDANPHSQQSERSSEVQRREGGALGENQ